MCLRRAPEKYIAGAALDRAGLDPRTDKIPRCVNDKESILFNVSTWEKLAKHNSGIQSFNRK
jgi:hypothetical protein